MGLWSRMTKTSKATETVASPASGSLDTTSTSSELGGWRTLAPIQRQLSDITSNVQTDSFADGLTTWQNPGLVGGLSHLVSPHAPSGLVSGLAQPAASRPAQEVTGPTLTFPARPMLLPQNSQSSKPAPIQRFAANADNLGTSEADDFGTSGAEYPRTSLADSHGTEAGSEAGATGPATAAASTDNASPVSSPVVSRSVAALQRLPVLSELSAHQQFSPVSVSRSMDPSVTGSVSETAVAPLSPGGESSPPPARHPLLEAPAPRVQRQIFALPSATPEAPALDSSGPEPAMEDAPSGIAPTTSVMPTTVGLSSEPTNPDTAEPPAVALVPRFGLGAPYRIPPRPRRFPSRYRTSPAWLRGLTRGRQCLRPWSFPRRRRCPRRPSHRYHQPRRWNRWNRRRPRRKHPQPQQHWSQRQKRPRVPFSVRSQRRNGRGRFRDRARPSRRIRRRQLQRCCHHK